MKSESEVKQVAWWQLVLMIPFAILVRLWGMSLRFKVDPDLIERANQAEPTIYILWHNRVFVIAEIYYRFRKQKGFPMNGLVSASKDGAWLAAFFRLCGIRAVRGSSSRRAMQSMRELINVEGDIAITPDGPRGPCYDFKESAVVLMRLTRRPLVLLGIRFSKAIRLKSWDGFYLPLPFSKVELTALRLDDANALPVESRAEMGAYLRDQMLQLNPDL